MSIAIDTQSWYDQLGVENNHIQLVGGYMPGGSYMIHNRMTKKWIQVHWRLLQICVNLKPSSNPMPLAKEKNTETNIHALIVAMNT